MQQLTHRHSTPRQPHLHLLHRRASDGTYIINAITAITAISATHIPSPSDEFCIRSLHSAARTPAIPAHLIPPSLSTTTKQSTDELHTPPHASLPLPPPLHPLSPRPAKPSPSQSPALRLPPFASPSPITSTLFPMPTFLQSPAVSPFSIPHPPSPWRHSFVSRNPRTYGRAQSSVALFRSQQSRSCLLINKTKTKTKTRTPPHPSSHHHSPAAIRSTGATISPPYIPHTPSSSSVLACLRMHTGNRQP